VDAFYTAKGDAVYAILPRRPVKEIVLTGIEAPGNIRVTMLEGGTVLEAAKQGGGLRVRVPDALAAGLPARQAYVLKISGAR
jgi:alpha-L-fucosidase